MGSLEEARILKLIRMLIIQEIALGQCIGLMGHRIKILPFDIDEVFNVFNP